MTNKFTAAAAASVIALTCVGTTGSAHAAGFFEQLFGIAPQPAPQVAPSYGYDAPQGYSPAAPVHHHAKRKVLAAVDGKPKLQKTTDLMHDVTLRTGDAIMMKGGIHIYTGDDRETRHASDDFAPLDAVRGVPREERKALVAMDTTRNDPLRGALVPDQIASGRSAAVANPVVAGHDIVDARGKSVRYVGP